MKLNKKGFTIVELVIVIAVIAILAAVLIPTFSTVIENANRSAALQEAKVAMDIVSMEEDAKLSGDYYVVTEKYEFIYRATAKTDDLDKEGTKTGILVSKPKTFVTDSNKQADQIKSHLADGTVETIYSNNKNYPDGVSSALVLSGEGKKLDVEKTSTDISSKVFVIHTEG